MFISPEKGGVLRTWIHHKRKRTGKHGYTTPSVYYQKKAISMNLCTTA